MQSVNDDMDELFRQAAEGYPLATSGAAWDKVASALNSEGAPVQAVAKDRSHRKLLWLLCLLPLGLLCHHWPSSPSGSLAGTKAAASLNKSVLTRENTRTQNTSSPVQLSTTSAFVHKKGLAETPDPFSSSSSNFFSNPAQENSAHHHPLFSTPDPANNKSSTVEIRYDKKAALPGNNVLSANTKFTRSFPSRGGVKPLLNVITASHENFVWKPIPELPLPPFHPKKFYAVLTGGLDATTVHFQKTDHLGHHFGVLIGYQLGRKWSVEAGLLLDRKYYYTEGDYFNTSKLYIPPGSRVTDIYGNCRMYEIPLAVHYQLSGRAHSSWFAGAGLSSYIMKREYYNYLYYYNSSATQDYYDHTYLNSSRNFLSVLQLSAGYSHSIGRTTLLRIEPYVKLPIAGIGFGKLPLLSTGLNIGILKSLF